MFEVIPGKVIHLRLDDDVSVFPSRAHGRVAHDKHGLKHDLKEILRGVAGIEPRGRIDRNDLVDAKLSQRLHGEIGSQTPVHQKTTLESDRDEQPGDGATGLNGEFQIPP